MSEDRQQWRGELAVEFLILAPLQHLVLTNPCRHTCVYLPISHYLIMVLRLNPASTNHRGVDSHSRTVQPYRSQVSSDATPTATPERATRILVPHQTIWERNLIANNTGPDSPVLLRTCYVPEPDGAYNPLAAQCEIGSVFGVEPGKVLDDPTRYSFSTHLTLGGRFWRASPRSSRRCLRQ